MVPVMNCPHCGRFVGAIWAGERYVAEFHDCRELYVEPDDQVLSGPLEELGGRGEALVELVGERMGQAAARGLDEFWSDGLSAAQWE